MSPLHATWIPGLDGHSGDAETLLMLASFIRFLRPALIVEAGTYRGIATAVMGNALREGAIDGEVWSADIEPYDAADTIRKNGLEDIVHLFHGDFDAMMVGPLAGRRPKMAFIDSGIVASDDAPPVEPRLRERHFLTALGRLQPGGVIAVDDCASEWDGVDTIRGTVPSIFLPQGRGLVLVQR